MEFDTRASTRFRQHLAASSFSDPPPLSAVKAEPPPETTALNCMQAYRTNDSACRGGLVAKLDAAVSTGKWRGITLWTADFAGEKEAAALSSACCSSRSILSAPRRKLGPISASQR